MPPLVQAAHERRMELLDNLPVGDLTDKVVVDFGVGSWGVACIAPKLQVCGLAIGIDISEVAVRESARLSHEGVYPYGDRWAYLVSDGRTLELHDESVDLLFGGEVIEHIDHTDAWLDEAYRVLKPGGTLILTTPNGEAPLYKGLGEEWCVNGEHVALMGWEELERRLLSAFEITVAKGFNMSFHGTIDGVVGLDLAKQWAAACEDRPDLANGVIVQCRKRDGYQRPQHTIEDLGHRDPRLRWHGAWEDIHLQESMTGRSGMEGASVGFDFEGTEVIVQFWCHPWSGIAEVTVDGNAQTVDLHSAYGGFRRVVVDGLADGPHRVLVTNTGQKRPTSQGAQVILHHVLAGRTA
jgi:SAM-dependent methyltransferase